MPRFARERLDDLLRRRILVLDGAIGTMIQSQGLLEMDYRGTRFLHHAGNLQGNHDLLSITRPEIISSLHHAYLDAGADIIKTNTFSSTSVGQACYGLESLAYELSSTGARLATDAAREWTNRTPGKPRFVAGSIGPTHWKLSRPELMNAPVSATMTVDRLRDAFRDQVRGLLDGGCDLLLIETIVDPLNMQAAFEAIDTVVDESRNEIPLMVSATFAPDGHHTLGGQTLGAFWTSVAAAHPFIVGINCSLGARHVRPALADLVRISNTWISCHPSAGLPNALGHYDEQPPESATRLREAAEEGLLNIAGGCCGTTPEHVRAIAEALKDVAPRHLPTSRAD
jgi:5-methyltetrahydrofolate--homocysteine methyltransferase